MICLILNRLSSGVIPFHGFTMFCAPFCYVYDDPVQMYFTFKAMYLRYKGQGHCNFKCWWGGYGL